MIEIVTPPRLQRIRMFDLPLDLFTVKELIEFLTDATRREQKTVVAYLNIHVINIAHDIQWYRDFLNRADAVFCDGIGALLGAWLLGNPVRSLHRLTAPDFFDDFILSCQRKGITLYLLGGKPGVVDLTLERIHEVAPQLQAYGHHGYFEKTGPENDGIIQKINSTCPGILYVGLGSPLQEQWIIENIHRIDARVFLPLGACLDYYTGTIRRGPRWLTDYGCEWICRLALEPRRLWKRYLIGNPTFFGRVAGQTIRRALAGLRDCV